MNEERRRAVRHPISLRVDFGSGTGVTRDVSGLGVLFETDAAFVAGDTLDFELAVADGVYVRCRGKVVRVTKIEGGRSLVGATIDGYKPPENVSADYGAFSGVILRDLAEHHPLGWEWGE